MEGTHPTARIAVTPDYRCALGSAEGGEADRATGCNLDGAIREKRSYQRNAVGDVSLTCTTQLAASGVRNSL
jgi:hypothetical protein